MEIKFFCVDGLVRNANGDDDEIAAFYQDPSEGWHLTRFDISSAVDACCIPIYDSIRKSIFTRQEFEDGQHIISTIFIYDAGIDPDADISKVDFEKILKRFGPQAALVNKALYWQDFDFLLSNVQSGLLDVISIAGEFYKSLSECSVFEQSFRDGINVTRTKSPKVHFTTLLMHMIFIRMHSVLDYLVKLSIEAERQKVSFENYPKLKGSNSQFGNRRDIYFNKMKGTVFEDCVFIKTIESIRTRIVHDGYLSSNQWVYIKTENKNVMEKFILFPDMSVNPGSFDKSGNRNSFYGEEAKINLMLPNMIREFYSRTSLTLHVIKENLQNKDIW